MANSTGGLLDPARGVCTRRARWPMLKERCRSSLVRISTIYPARSGRVNVRKAPFRTILRPIEPCRIVDQKRFLQRGGGGDLRDHVDQDAVVGRRVLHVGMWPVRAPQDAVR